MGKKRYGSFIEVPTPMQDELEIGEKQDEIEIEDKQDEKENEEKQDQKENNSTLFLDKTGHITFESISENREWFYGKSIKDIANFLKIYGYVFVERDSIYIEKGSKAKILEIKNTTKERNISQIQVSPGSSRHGDVSYVKISTIDIGKIKIINSSEKEYKTDGEEKAKLLFRRDD